MPTIADHDYEAEDTMVVSDPKQLRALADDLRAQLIQLLRDRARSTQELSEELGIPKGTVGHHLKVLERAGLIRVVRTRQVRALTEKFYGRTARLFLYQAEDPADERAIAATMLRQAAREVEQAPDSAGFGHMKARLSKKDADRFERRLRRLLNEMHAADSPGGDAFGLAVAFYRRRTDA